MEDRLLLLKLGFQLLNIIEFFFIATDRFHMFYLALPVWFSIEPQIKSDFLATPARYNPTKAFTHYI